MKDSMNRKTKISDNPIICKTLLQRPRIKKSCFKELKLYCFPF